MLGCMPNWASSRVCVTCVYMCLDMSVSMAVCLSACRVVGSHLGRVALEIRARVRN